MSDAQMSAICWCRSQSRRYPPTSYPTCETREASNDSPSDPQLLLHPSVTVSRDQVQMDTKELPRGLFPSVFINACTRYLMAARSVACP